MAIYVEEKSGPQVPPGTHVAVCYRIVDLGTQPDSGYGQKQKLVVFWELPHERIQIDGHDKPMGISKFYTKSIGKKASLRKDLEAWRGRPFTPEELVKFDLHAILGKGCQLQVVPDDTGKSRVTAVVGLPKGTQVPPPFNQAFEWSVTDGKESPNWAKLPEWVQTMASQCMEWTQPAKTTTPTADAPPPEDDDGTFPPF